MLWIDLVVFLGSTQTQVPIRIGLEHQGDIFLHFFFRPHPVTDLGPDHMMKSVELGWPEGLRVSPGYSRRIRGIQT